MSAPQRDAPPRIKSLDVVRGFALLGILAVNAIYFAAPWQDAVNPLLAPLAVTDATLWSWALMHVVFEGKCITLFSMLFGASLYLVGGEREDEARGATLRRRLFWLAVFGLMHGVLIWYGDVLLLYAICGFLAMLARSWSVAALLRTGLVLFALSLLLAHALVFAIDYIPADSLAEIKRAAWAPGAAEIDATIAAYRGGWRSGLPENFDTWAMFAGNGLLTLVPRTAAMMMFGLALYKTGFLSGAASVRVYVAALAVGAIALALIAWQAALKVQARFDFAYMQRAGVLANSVLAPLVSIGYASLLISLVKARTFGLVTNALAAVGRMAFTNYIAQSLIMTTLCWGGARGFGLYGQLDRTQLWLIVVCVWAAQLIWSRLWLQGFAMGPLEYVWRRLSYNRPLSIKDGA